MSENSEKIASKVLHIVYRRDSERESKEHVDWGVMEDKYEGRRIDGHQKYILSTLWVTHRGMEIIQVHELKYISRVVTVDGWWNLEIQRRAEIERYDLQKINKVLRERKMQLQTKKKRVHYNTQPSNDSLYYIPYYII